MLNDLKKAIIESQGVDDSIGALMMEAVADPEIVDRFLEDDDKGIGKGAPINISKLIDKIPESDLEVNSKDEITIETAFSILNREVIE